MSPYHGYPFGKVKLERGLYQNVLPWHIIEALMEHACHAGRPVTNREADGVLGLLSAITGNYTSRFSLGNHQELVVETTFKPRVTFVTLQTAGGHP